MRLRIRIWWVALLGCAGTALHAQDATYDWVSSDNNPIVASITLDSDQSPTGGGSLSDVVSFTIDGTTFTHFTGFDGPFTWDTNWISSLPFLQGTDYLGPPSSFDEIVANIERNYVQVYIGGDYPGARDTSGYWAFAGADPDPVGVPDSPQTLWLLAPAALLVAGLRRQWR